MAHPDDVDFGAAGTVAAWTSAGVEVSYCVCTSGDAGDSSASRAETAHVRQAEQRPWTVPELWLADSPAWLRNHVVDVTDTFDKRLAALRAHASQVGGMADIEGFVRGYLTENARRHGLADGQLAEEFQVVGTR
jgi:LmbE family N-acetylglucosaminyl deacetylase